MYFGKEVETAIRQYCESPTRREKEKVFSSVIYPALNKLAENVIHNKKFYNYGPEDYVDVKHDCVVHLVERLEKYNPDRGSSAFSYFNRVTINWVWAEMKKVSDNTIGKVDVVEIDNNRDLDQELFQSDYLQELREFCLKWSNWGNSNLDYFYFYDGQRIKPFTKKDREIANAIFDLFQNSSNIDILDKKALYIMIRDRTDVQTQKITDVIKVLRPLCKDMYFDYKINGTKYWHRFLYYPEEIEMDDIYMEEDIDNED